MVTFTGSNGQRIKNISFKNFWYHTKDAPLLVRWGKTGDGQYGPFAGFEVHGDTSGEYMFKPGKDAPPSEEWWPTMESQIKATKGGWVLATATFVGEHPALTLEDEEGLVFPAETVQAAVRELDLAPVNEAARRIVSQPTVAQASGTPLQADQDLMLRCAIIAGGVVDGFAEHLGRPMTENDRTIAISLFIQHHR